MTSAQTTIVTATYNKPEFLVDAAESVFGQTRSDWQWWLILDGADIDTQRLADGFSARDPRVTVFREATSEEDRKREYRPAVLINEYYPRVETPYLCWLSDDDLLEPDFLELLIAALHDQPEYDVAYGACEVVNQVGANEWQHRRWLPAERPLGRAAGKMPDFVIDGGQILQTTRSHAALNGYRLPTDFQDARHIDGVYLNQLAERFTFLPVNRKVMTHRCTYLSTHTPGVK